MTKLMMLQSLFLLGKEREYIKPRMLLLKTFVLKELILNCPNLNGIKKEIKYERL